MSHDTDRLVISRDETSKIKTLQRWRVPELKCEFPERVPVVVISTCLDPQCTAPFIAGKNILWKECTQYKSN